MDIESLILLNTIEVLGFKKLESLLGVFGSASGILKAKKSDLLRVSGINKELADKIANLDKKKLSKELRLAEKAGARAVSVFDKDYPENLKNIYSPPVILYIKGKIIPEDSDAVAMVGSRHPSYYGLATCEKLADQLASRGITVISGLARGIDTAAHKGAVKNGRTVAVLGSGLSLLYPPENRLLAEKICGNGAVISEFPMETPPNSRNFPKRNRVISGLSLGVLVVEATEKSGSLITANFALDENRELFAIPGQVGFGTSAGSNNLIKQGAKLVEGPDDIIEEIESRIKYTATQKQRDKRLEKSAKKSLTSEENMMKRFLSHEPVYIDKLAEKSNMSVSEVGTLLLSLELKSVIKELPGKNFILR